MSGTTSDICEPVVVVTPFVSSEAQDAPPPSPPRDEGDDTSGNPATPSETSGRGTLDDFTCPVCMDLFIGPALTNCDHRFCTFCLASWFHLRGRKNCPSCRAIIDRLTPNPDVAQTVEDLVQEHFTAAQKVEREETKQVRLTSDIMTRLGPNPLETLMTQTPNEYRFEFDSIGVIGSIDIQIGQGTASFDLSQFLPGSDLPGPPPGYRRIEPESVAEITRLLDRFEMSLRESQVHFRELMEGAARVDPAGRYFQMVDQRLESLDLTPQGRQLLFAFPNEELDGSDGSRSASGARRPSHWYWNHRRRDFSWARRSDWGTSPQDEIPVHDGDDDRIPRELSWTIGADMMNAVNARPGPGEPDPLEEFVTYPFQYPPPPATYGLNHQWGAESAPGGPRRSSPRGNYAQSPPRRNRQAYEEFPPPPHPNHLNGFPFFDGAIYPEFHVETVFAEQPYEYTERSPTRGRQSPPRRPRVHSGNHITTEAQNICVVHPDGTETWVDFADSPGGTPGDDHRRQRRRHRDDGSAGEGPYSEDEDDSSGSGASGGLTSLQEENYEIEFVVHHHCCAHGSHSGDPQQ